VRPGLQDHVRARKLSESCDELTFPPYIFECGGERFCRYFANSSCLASFLLYQFNSDWFLTQNGRIISPEQVLAGVVFHVIIRLKRDAHRKWKTKALKEAFKVAVLAHGISDDEARFIEKRARFFLTPDEPIGSLIKHDMCQKLFDETVEKIEGLYKADYCKGYTGVFNLGTNKKDLDRFVSLLKNFWKKMIRQPALYLWLMSVVSITKVKFGTFSVEVLRDFLLILVRICF
jgi:hypothetical protein